MAGSLSKSARPGSQSLHSVAQECVCWPGSQASQLVVDIKSRSAVPGGQQLQAAAPSGVNVPAPHTSHGVAGLWSTSPLPCSQVWHCTVSFV